MLVLCFSNMKAQETDVTVRGFIFSAEDSSAVPMAHLLGSDSANGTTTDAFGYFSLTLRTSDTLTIKSINFWEEKIAVADIAYPTRLLIYLNPKAYELRQVTVTDYSFERFKKDFLAVKLPQEKYTIDLKIPEDFDFSSLRDDRPPPVKAPNDIGSAGCVVARFGWSPTQRKIDVGNAAIAHWVNDDVRRQAISDKFSGSMVKRHVPITDDKIEAFLKYCKLPDEFILKANEYDIGMAIKDCYLAFLDANR